MSEAIYGQCPGCGQAMSAGHRCWPPRPHAPTPAPLAEDDVRRIVREELAKALAWTERAPVMPQRGELRYYCAECTADYATLEEAKACRHNTMESGHEEAS